MNSDQGYGFYELYSTNESVGGGCCCVVGVCHPLKNYTSLMSSGTLLYHLSFFFI